MDGTAFAHLQLTPATLGVFVRRAARVGVGRLKSMATA